MNRKRHGQSWIRRMRQALYHHRQEAARSLSEIWRAPFASLLTLAVIGVSLALPATFWVMLQNTSQVTSQWQEGGVSRCFCISRSMSAALLSLPSSSRAIRPSPRYAISPPRRG